MPRLCQAFTYFGSSSMAVERSATALSGSSINLTWTDTTASPNTASGYKVEQSTDNAHFTEVTTAPAGATSIAIGGLAPLTTYYFRIRGFNGLGDSPYSNVASDTTGQSSQAPNAPSGLGAVPASGTSVSVTWTNNDDRDHDIVAKDKSFKSDNLVLCRADRAMEQRCDRFRHARGLAG